MTRSPFPDVLVHPMRTLLLLVMSAAAPLPGQSAPLAAAGGWPLDTTAAAAGQCRAAPYRALDFLHGTWRVEGARGGPPQPSVLQAVLDGCATLEHFADGAGRSLTYRDPVTGAWYQDYIDTQRLTLRLVGEVRADTLRMSDSVRIIPGGPQLRSRFEWARAPGAAGFRQQWWFSTDAGRTESKNFDGQYRAGPVEGSAPPAPVDSTCGTRLKRLALRGLLGTWHLEGDPRWRMRGDRPSHPCTVEVQIAGPRGLAAWWLFYEDTYVRTVHAVLLDNTGRVARLRAPAPPNDAVDAPLDFAGLALSAKGAEPVTLRLTLEGRTPHWQPGRPVASGPSRLQRWLPAPP